MSERKDRSVQISVALIGCLGTIVVAIITGIFSLLTLSASRTADPVVPTATPVSISNPVNIPPTQTQPMSTAQIQMPVASTTSNQIDLSGLWSGYLTYILGDSVYNFNYQLELSQDGIVITGKSRIEQIANINNFAEYYLGAQLLLQDGQAVLKVDETDLASSHNYTDFLFTETIAAKEMSLNYLIRQGKEMLEGTWWSYGFDTSPDGRIQLSKQP